MSIAVYRPACSMCGCVQIWRRAYDVPPPALEEKDPRYAGNDPRYKVRRRFGLVIIISYHIILHSFNDPFPGLPR